MAEQMQFLHRQYSLDGKRIMMMYLWWGILYTAHILGVLSCLTTQWGIFFFFLNHRSKKEKKMKQYQNNQQDACNNNVEVVSNAETQQLDNTEVIVPAKAKRNMWDAHSMAVMAILTAVSYILYLFVKFPLPFLFPAFLDIQISEMPALLGGFALGPVQGAIIVIVKCLLKLPFSSTACVGELGT